MKVPLKEAVEVYQKEQGATANSYEWYRKSAQRHGNISIGGEKIAAHKQRGIWYVDEEELASGIEQHRKKTAYKKKVTADHAKGIIHGSDGDIIRTDWGGYQVRKGFRFEWSDQARYMQRSDGEWYCNKCNRLAKKEHGREKCHTCRDWNGCGKDCTLSKIYCSKCETSISV